MGTCVYMHACQHVLRHIHIRQVSSHLDVLASLPKAQVGLGIFLLWLGVGWITEPTAHAHSCLAKWTLLATTCLVPAEWSLFKSTLSLFIGLPSSQHSLQPMITLFCVISSQLTPSYGISSFDKYVCGLCWVLETG